MKRRLMIFLSFIVVLLLTACKQEKTVTTEPDTLKPVLSGIYSKTITVGDEFDPMEGVTATDVCDFYDFCSLTSQIEVTGDYDVNKAGNYTITYTVTDKSGNKTSLGRTLVVKEKYLTNKDFSAGDTGWGYWNGEGGTGSFEVVDGMAKVTVESIGNFHYSIQFEQVNLTLEKGKSYKISFKAKADDARTIGIVVEDPANGYHKYAIPGEGIKDGQKIINVTTEMQEFSIDIEIDTNTISTGKLGLMLGKVDDNSKPTTLYFDDFNMEEVIPGPDEVKPVINGANDLIIEAVDEFDPFAGITVSDNRDDLTVKDVNITMTSQVLEDNSIEYTINYSVKDLSGNEGTATRKIKVIDVEFTDTNDILNADFETDEEVEHNSTEGKSGWLEWHQDWNGKAEVTFKIENGELTVATTVLGDANAAWTIQLQQEGITLEKGRTYKLTFDAKSNVARDINAVIKTTSDSVYTNKTVSLTDTLTTYTHIFEVTGDTNTNMILAVEFGKMGETPAVATITLDNFKLYVAEE